MYSNSLGVDDSGIVVVGGGGGGGSLDIYGQL